MNKKTDFAQIGLVGCIICILLAVLTTKLNAQERVSFSLHLDPKLMFFGDGNNYEAGTLNIYGRFKMQGLQQKHGYMVVMPTFEYANLEGIYKRYSADVGYTFNRYYKNVETSVYGGYGWIDRYGKTTFSFSATAELAYIIGSFKISAITQLTQRTDLMWLYGKTEYRFSGFVGLEFNL
jgi:hypothetical protein